MAQAWDKLHEVMFSQSVASSALLDPDQVIIRANRQFADHFGVAVEECVGRRLADLMADGALLDCVRRVGRTLRPAKTSVRIRCGAPSAEQRDWRWSVAPVLDSVGGVEALFLCGVDVTELRRAKEDLRLRQNVYESVFTCMNEGVVFQAASGLIVAANPAAERMLGVSLKTMLTRDSHTPEWDALREDGTCFPPEEHPAMVTLESGRPVSDVTMGVLRPDGDRIWISINSQPVNRAGAGAAQAVVTTFHDVTERRAAEKRQTLMIHELNHRVKNTLALVQAIAAESIKSSPTLAAFAEAFNTRLLALSHSHDVLTRTDWTGAQLRDLVAGQLSPFISDSDERLEIVGPDVVLPPKVAIALGVALGELATNAVKYGALSGEQGAVSVTWACTQELTEPRLRILWRESGGPRVPPPERRGLGVRLIERGLPYELGGTARLFFDPDGARCEIELPLGWQGP